MNNDNILLVIARPNILVSARFSLQIRKYLIIGRFNFSYSEWKDVTSGIPQGSVLGPVLFVIYINDMPETIQSLCRLFADDSKIYRRVKTNEDQEIIQSDLLRLCNWSDKWLLDFSVPKCKVVQYGTNIIEFIYKMRDNNTGLLKNLPCVEEEKDLGIKFSNTLKFDNHISMAVNKANQIVGLIKRSLNYMDKSMFLKLYKSIVRPHLDYGDAVWYPALKKNKRLVENVQRRATRIVPELQGFSYEERLRELNLPTLDYRRKRGDLIHLFKMIHGYHDIDSSKLFSFNENTTRGHMYKISKPRCQKSLRLNAFPARCIDNWNRLPADLVNLEKVDSFKNKLDIVWRDIRFDVSEVY